MIFSIFHDIREDINLVGLIDLVDGRDISLRYDGKQYTFKGEILDGWYYISPRANQYFFASSSNGTLGFGCVRYFLNGIDVLFYSDYLTGVPRYRMIKPIYYDNGLVERDDSGLVSMLKV